MAKYDYVEKAIKFTRREFLGIMSVSAATLWSGVYMVTDLVKDRSKYIKMRAAGLYKDDHKAQVRQSHNNESLQEMYRTFADKPLSPIAEELLHTHYFDRTKLKKMA
jgi:ferredoxin hydrogenase small subunit